MLGKSPTGLGASFTAQGQIPCPHLANMIGQQRELAHVLSTPLCSGHQAADSAGWASRSLQPLQPGSGSATSPGLLELLHGLCSTMKVPAPALTAIPGPLGICRVRHSEVYVALVAVAVLYYEGIWKDVWAPWLL